MFLLLSFPFLIAADKKPLVLNSGIPGQVRSGDSLVDASGGKIWTINNDGAGSTLDADLLDGLDSSGFGDATAANQTTIINDTKYIYTTAIGGAPVANSIAARIDAAISSRLATAINNIQRGELTITTGQTTPGTSNITITAVVLAKSFITITWSTDANSSSQVAGYLSTTTNLAITWIYATTTSIYLKWEVIEFK